MVKYVPGTIVAIAGLKGFLSSLRHYAVPWACVFLSLNQEHRVPLQNLLRLQNWSKPFVLPTLQLFTFI